METKLSPNQLEPWCNLQGKVVLVTGASSGLGREFCLDLAKAGSKVVAVARRTDRLKSLCDQINKNNPKADINPQAIAVQLDVSAGAQTIKDSIDKAWNAFGHIDALINNAGIRGSRGKGKGDTC